MSKASRQMKDQNRSDTYVEKRADDAPPPPIQALIGVLTPPEPAADQGSQAGSDSTTGEKS